jgi:FMN phosphatase YigB (HAD superfamily)
MDHHSVIFFDIGGTLGTVNVAGQFVAFPESKQLLAGLRQVVGTRLGVITNLPGSMTTADARTLLQEAGLLAELDQAGIITNHDAGASKPAREIDHFAADRMQTPISRCVYSGETLAEVDGAQAAGMFGVLKKGSL